MKPSVSRIVATPSAGTPGLSAIGVGAHAERPHAANPHAPNHEVRARDALDRGTSSSIIGSILAAQVGKRNFFITSERNWLFRIATASCGDCDLLF
jgi:hypothetical protein